MPLMVGEPLQQAVVATISNMCGLPQSSQNSCPEFGRIGTFILLYDSSFRGSTNALVLLQCDALLSVQKFMSVDGDKTSIVNVDHVAKASCFYSNSYHNSLERGDESVVCRTTRIDFYAAWLLVGSKAEVTT